MHTGQLGRSNQQKKDEPEEANRSKIGQKESKMKHGAMGKQDIRALED